MRTKSLVEPMGVAEGHEWLSPDGHSPSWHKVFQDGKWEATVYEEMSGETDDSTDDDDQPEEDHADEQGMQTAIPDSDGGEQGASGKPEPEPQQRGKRGKVRKGGKGK